MMKLNFCEAYHYWAQQKFKDWLATHKQGRMKLFNEWTDDGMYKVPEADNDKNFIKWLDEKRKADKERQKQYRKENKNV